ncbi:MAG TPA: ATP-binding protein [Candidatus Saccharimonadales bacterium]
MALEFFQYQVSKFWYRVFWGTMLGFTLLFGTLNLAARFIGPFSQYTGLFEVGAMSLVWMGVTFLYLVTVFWMLARYSWPFATLIGAMLFTYGLLSSLAVADPAQGVLLYICAWLSGIFFSGIYGLPTLIGSVYLVFVYIMLMSGLDLTKVTRPMWLLAVSAIILAFLAYFFWKQRFTSIEEQKVSQLSGMLQSNRQQSEILIQSISDGIVMTDTTGKITLINPAAAAMTQWPINEAINIDARLVLKLRKEDGAELEDQEQDPFTTAISLKEHIKQTLQLVGREGKEITISLSVSPVLIGNEPTPRGAVAVVRDVSEERVAEKQRAEFISTASHEMRTPVAAIEGYLALALNDKVSTIDTRARGFLDKAHASTQHLGKLFQDLLTSSKAEDGRLSNHPTVVEMGAFMQQLSDDLKFAAEKKGLLAEFVIGGADETIDATTKDAASQHIVKPLYYTHVDPERMREVITNLFDNACKYTDSGKVTIGLTANTEVVQIYIRDTGAGIPAEDIPHLFQKFYRVDSSATRTIGGTGLGLFISRKIVELYHGRIWVESEVGAGSTFFINLPRLASARAAELQAAEASQTLSRPTGLPAAKS